MAKAIMLDDQTYNQLKKMADQTDTKMASIVRQYLLDKKTIYDDLENKLKSIEGLFIFSFIDNNVALNDDAMRTLKTHHPFLRYITLAKEHLKSSRQSYLDEY